MRALSALELLEVWERGLAQGPVERALTLLAAACPETPLEVLASFSIGRRDADLLTLRERTFGSQMASVAMCPQCGEQLEFSFSAADLRVSPPSEPEQVTVLTVDGYELQFRPPNSLDLAALISQPDPADQQRLLIESCLLVAHREGEPIAVAQLPANIIDAIEDGMARADPQADVRLAISCPACNHQWQGIFDIVTFFWSEIESWASRILHEVHLLASAYGWHEREILALSPRRRQFYLDRVSG
jgi:hypothetical protein